jgi:hypothetical protein
MASGGVHLLSGLAIGTLAPSRRVAFTGGIASHAVFDAVPHRDYESWSANAIDTAVAAALAAVLAGLLPKERRVRAFLGAIGGLLPDTETVAFKAGLLPAERRVFPSHTGLIRHGRSGAGWTAALSIASVVAAGLAVRAVRKRRAWRVLPEEGRIVRYARARRADGAPGEQPSSSVQGLRVQTDLNLRSECEGSE